MRRYLIVDNHAAVRLALKVQLLIVTPAAQVREVESADEALGQAESWKPTAVFTGMRLKDGEPAMPMVETLLEKDPARPVVLVTSMPSDHPDVRHCISIGAFAHVPKPVRRDAVRQVVRQFDEARGTLERIP